MEERYWMRPADGIDPFQFQRRATEQAVAEQVRCPEPKCRALPGDPCVNIHTGRPLTWLPAHHKRLTEGRRSRVA